MDYKNRTIVTEFTLAGLTENSELKLALFVLFFIIYSLTLLQNSVLIVLISWDGQLYSPMYVFLRQLSFIDICYSSSVTIRMLVDFVSDKSSISVAGCFLNGFVQTGFSFFHLDFCENPQAVHHFYCDVIALIEISCGDTRLNEMILFSIVGFIELSSLFVILVSYLCIIIAVLQIRSSKGRKKAFSTCASHLTVVSMFYGSIMFMYLRPSSAYSPEQDKIIAVFYTVIIPFLNPLIYSLRNREVKNSARKIGMWVVHKCAM
ncbi:hypothetical protein GDO81_001160 [Engystomops pustulosus]|uniref:G-protein coupled receptors family 1 profile domain-containing protein n=1 Tax=Engystomops pustulosus TaxID=76066 RepID=A0AAV7DA68_ENGPU|nr:hypothetical protein GDO81_001160 [Engystomops pustulosus]